MSRIKVRLQKGLIEAIWVKSCWPHVPARPDFVEPSVFHFNVCENDVPSKITFAQGNYDVPGSNVMSFSHHILNFGAGDGKLFLLKQTYKSSLFLSETTCIGIFV